MKPCCEHNRTSAGGAGYEKGPYQATFQPFIILSSWGCLEACVVLIDLWLDQFLDSNLPDSRAVAAGVICPLQEPGAQISSPWDKPGFTQHLMRTKLSAGPMPKVGSLLMSPSWHTRCQVERSQVKGVVSNMALRHLRTAHGAVTPLSPSLLPKFSKGQLVSFTSRITATETFRF